MKKTALIVSVLVVVANMDACGDSSKISETSSVIDDNLSNEIESLADEGTNLQEESAASDSGAEMQLKAFGKVLWDAYQKGTLPDGHSLDYINVESAEKNCFAITDIDGDGADELMLIWKNACMAGMVTYVFGYDDDDGEIYVELSDWPSLTFYDNGVVKAEWSHNQGLAGDFWPYDVYCYDAENDVYQFCGGVDAWDRSFHEETYKGDVFPLDIDVDGDGIIYYILPADWDGQYDMPLVDGADYERWQSSYFEGAEEINISTKMLTEENIAALGYPKPYVSVPQPVG